MPFFDFNDVKIYYEVAGQGPPLLLINGIGANTRQWEPLVQLLKDSYQVIFYDMRCAGKSDKPKEPITIPRLAEEAVALAKHLNHDKIDLLGYSMGGLVAQEVALSYPKIVRKLVLLGTVPSLKRPYPPSNHSREMLHAKKFSTDFLQKTFYLLLGRKYRDRVTVEEYIKTALENKNPQPAEAYWNQLQALESYDLVDKVCNIQVPTLVAMGERDKAIPPENSEWLAQRIPNAILRTFKGVGHIIPLEGPEELAVCLKDFLN